MVGPRQGDVSLLPLPLMPGAGPGPVPAMAPALLHRFPLHRSSEFAFRAWGSASHGNRKQTRRVSHISACSARASFFDARGGRSSFSAGRGNGRPERRRTSGSAGDATASSAARGTRPIPFRCARRVRSKASARWLLTRIPGQPSGFRFVLAQKRAWPTRRSLK